jgi:tRNA threonylcarbamoyladenosine biosynthesis protein TsaB
MLLAFDTTMARCSVALCSADGRDVWAAESLDLDKGHAEALAPMVQRCLAAASCTPEHLTRIAVTQGPGTFTGLRIGLSLAHGMGSALACPVVGLDTLTATAAPLLASHPELLVVHRAGATGKFYAARIAARRKEVELHFADAEACVRLAGDDKLPIIGTGADDMAALAPTRVQRIQGYDLPSAEEFAAFAASLPLVGGYPMPIYLREPDAKPSASTPALVLRNITTADLPALSHLHGLCFEAGWSAESLASTLALPGAMGLVAELDGHVRAFMIVQQALDEAEILTLCTEPRWRRRALAERLLAQVRTILRTQSVSRLHLEVAADNVAAQALYEHQGFSRIGARKGYYARPAGAVDAVLMSVAP